MHNAYVRWWHRAFILKSKKQKCNGNTISRWWFTLFLVSEKWSDRKLETWKDGNSAVWDRTKLRTQPSSEVSINGETINRVNQYQYLGVTFDQDMSFSEQLSKVSKKLSQWINMLKRVMVNITSATANIIYNSMIAPMMLYCSPVYLRLPSVHQKFTKLETRAYKTITIRLQNTITNKIKQRSAVEVFKHIHQLKKNDIIKFDAYQHNISTRGNGNRLVIPKSKNEAGRRSFNTQGALYSIHYPNICEMKNLFLYVNA